MTNKKKKTQAFMQPVEISKDLEAITGPGPMARSEITKKLWEYIKKNKRQDTQNKRQINPDDKLAKLFGTSKPVDMFQMTKLVSKHIKKPKTTAAAK